MDTAATITMVSAMALIWGGLVASIVNAVRKSRRRD